MMKLPKYSYLFMISRQPDRQAWNALLTFAEEWNASHKTPFTCDNSLGEDVLTIEFDNYLSAEKVQFDEKMHTLCLQYPVVSFGGIVDNRYNDDFIGSDFVQLGEQFYDENKFFVNPKKVFVELGPCSSCGKYYANALQVQADPIVDVTFLDKNTVPNTNFDPQGVDFIGTPGGGTIVTDKVKNLIESSGATGAVFLPVIDKNTNDVTNRLYLLAAKKAVTDYCPEHTPRDEEGICGTCGSYTGRVYGFPYIPEEWLQNDEIFSLSPHGYSAIYFSKRLYELFVRENVRGIYVLRGIDSCNQH